MLQLYLPHEPELRQSTSIGIRSDDGPIIVAANTLAGWLLDIVGPFFWAALIMMLLLAETLPRR